MSKVSTSFKNLQFGRIFKLPGGTRQIEFLFSTANGDPGHLTIDWGDLAELRMLQRQLRNSGFSGPSFTRADALALDELVMQYSTSSKGRKAMVTIRPTGGWNMAGSNFVLADLEYPSGRRVVGAHDELKRALTRKGNLAGWQATVGKAAVYSSRAMLLIAAALAAPTLKLHGIEAGGFGFNLWGPSSMGKTTALRAAASVTASDFAGTWNATSMGIQDLAEQYCDLPLTIDGLESLGADKQNAVSESVAYALGSGKPRVRAAAWNGTNRDSNNTWRTILLSTSESQHQRLQKAGAAVRFVDVPVAADQLSSCGIVDCIPPQMNAERQNVFSSLVIRQLSTGSARHFGHALPAFLMHITKDVAASQKQLAHGRARFLESFRCDELTNAETRVVSHFAVVYSAGKLAIECGLLPWPEPHFRAALHRCATDAIQNTTDRAQRNKVNAQRVLDWLNGPTRRLSEHSPTLNRLQISTTDALVAEVSGPQDAEDEFHQTKLVLRVVLQKALSLSGKQVTGAMAYLRQQGKLITEGRHDALTIQYKFSDCSARFYVVRDA